MTEGPLAGIRVLDLTRIVAGPFATMRMADLGAEVIKVENPDGGDESRQIRPPEAGGEAFYYLAYNRSKRSIAVDLRTEGGKGIIDRLAARSDVLIQNFRVGVMERLGLGYEAVRARHPHLVYCSISAYGRTGPMTARPGFDPVLQAESGMMAITGEPDGPPMRHALSIIDTLTSHYACEAVLAALIARGRSGRGQHIDISLMDGAVASLSNAAQMHLLTGEEPPRTGNRHQSAVPVGMFETRTGPFYMAIGYDRLFREMCAPSAGTISPGIRASPPAPAVTVTAGNCTGCSRNCSRPTRGRHGSRACRVPAYRPVPFGRSPKPCRRRRSGPGRWCGRSTIRRRGCSSWSGRRSTSPIPGRRIRRHPHCSARIRSGCCGMSSA